MCGEPVHWRRLYLRNWVGAVWSCRRCFSLLGFERKRRGLVAVFYVLFFLWVGWLRVHWAVALLLIVAGTVILEVFTERVVVIGYRSRRFCPACRYDLRGTLAAGITTCPECGTPAAESQAG